MVFLWACLELESLGIICFNAEGKLQLGVEVPKCKRFDVPEPGNKVRIVTMTHACLSLFL